MGRQPGCRRASTGVTVDAAKGSKERRCWLRRGSYRETERSAIFICHFSLDKTRSRLAATTVEP